LIASLCSVGLTILVLGPLGWGLAGAALAVTLPLTIVNVTYLPLLVCRKTGLSVARYFKATAAEPMVRILPFAICLVIARLVFGSQPLTGLACAGVAGGVILAAVYWLYVLPEKIKLWTLRFVGVKGIG